MRHFAHRLKAVASALLLALWSAGALAAPQVGWWWNPNESGRGFFIESQGGIMYLAGYFYDASGRPTWLVAGGPNANPYSFDGNLSSYAGGQTLFGAYKPPIGPVDAGPISVRFSDDTHASLTWAGGTIPLQRHVFGGTEPEFQPLPGWWWNPNESGRGFSVELQGNTLFVASFMYDDAGNPAWYISAGPMATPTHYEGPWRRYANGQTMTGSYHPPEAPQTVGVLAVDFIQANKATMTFTPAASVADGPVPKAGPAITVPVVREFQPTFELRQQYVARFNYRATYISAASNVKYEISGGIPFKREPDEELAPLPLLDPAGISYLPDLTPGTTIFIDYKSTITVGPGFVCTSFGQKTAPIPAGGQYRLEISNLGPYIGRLEIPKVAFDVNSTCEVNGVPFSSHDVDDGLHLIIPMQGHLGGGTMFGHTDIGIGAKHVWWVSLE